MVWDHMLALRETEHLVSAFSGSHTMLSALYVFTLLDSQPPSFAASPTGGLAVLYYDCHLHIPFICVAGDTRIMEGRTADCSWFKSQGPHCHT